VSGESSAGIALQGNLLEPGQQAVRTSAGARKDAARVV
jgi:hypothetical protein